MLVLSHQVALKLRHKITKQENLESLLVILIGIIGGDAFAEQELDRFRNDAALDQFVKIDEASPKELAKLAAFVSQSVSSQSQALGSGAPSASLGF